MFGNKATTLSYLKKRILNDACTYHIPKIYSFSFEEWQTSQEDVFMELRSNMSGIKYLAVRSCASVEDTHESSNAGAFFS